MKKLWTDLHSNIHHNQMDELDKWTEHAKEVLDFWPIAYYPFQMIKKGHFPFGLENAGIGGHPGHGKITVIGLELFQIGGIK